MSIGVPGVLSGEPGEQREVPDMQLKEVAEAGERSNGLDVVWLGTYIDGAEFVFPRLDALGVSVNPK